MRVLVAALAAAAVAAVAVAWTGQRRRYPLHGGDGQATVYPLNDWRTYGTPPWAPR
jgi:hypothetical protein